MLDIYLTFTIDNKPQQYYSKRLWLRKQFIMNCNLTSMYVNILMFQLLKLTKKFNYYYLWQIQLSFNSRKNLTTSVFITITTLYWEEGKRDHRKFHTQQELNRGPRKCYYALGDWGVCTFRQDSGDGNQVLQQVHTLYIQWDITYLKLVVSHLSVTPKMTAVSPEYLLNLI